MDILTKKSADLDEREKLFKLVQYFVHFVQAAQGKNDYQAISILQSSRQALRFGKCVQSLNQSVTHLSIQDSVFRTTLVLSRISESLYYVCDHLAWLSKLGLVNMNRDKLANMSELYLLYAQLLMLLKNVYQMQIILKSRYYTIDCFTDKISLVSHVKHFVNFNKALSLEIVGNVCDILLCLHRLDRIQLGRTKMSLIGILSALLPFLRYRNTVLF